MLGEENPDLLSSMGRTRPEHALTLFILGEHLTGAAAANYQASVEAVVGMSWEAVKRERARPMTGEAARERERRGVRPRGRECAPNGVGLRTSLVKVRGAASSIRAIKVERDDLAAVGRAD